MPPTLATFLTIGFIVYLFRRDLKEKPDVTAALWLPFWWMIISCTRSATLWLTVFGLPAPGGSSLEEGSPADSALLAVLILSGLRVLARRRVTLGEVVRNNVWLTIFIFYCLLAVLWSDFPFVSLKRWIKVIGHPIMALIVLTEPNKEEALTCLIKRCAYIILPVSLLFIKYYPELGRGFDSWTGLAVNTGITADKNLLGLDCLIIGYFLIWHLLRVRKWPKGTARSRELALCILLLSMNFWLLSVSNSKTPTVSLTVGVIIMLFAGLSWVSKQFIGGYLFAAGMLILVSEWMFSVYERFLVLLGRNPTLTDRTLLWEDLLNVEINPLVGAGFESFWLGDRLRHMWNLWAFHPNQAHNGYLETYLNLGIIGLVLMLAVFVSNYRKACREILVNLDWGRFRLGFIVALVIYNWTEAAFKATHPLFFMLYLIALDLPGRGEDEEEEEEDEEEEFPQSAIGLDLDRFASDACRLAPGAPQAA